jgi:PHD/YefM family antitoxin component YafN of YafNO toxin-antitoxin module
MDAIQDIRPISEVKQNFFALAERIKKTGRPIYITKNGRAELTVLKTEDYQFLINEKEKNDFREIMYGLEDVKKGKTRPAKEFFDEVRTKYGF